MGGPNTQINSEGDRNRNIECGPERDAAQPGDYMTISIGKYKIEEQNDC